MRAKLFTIADCIDYGRWAIRSYSTTTACIAAYCILDWVIKLVMETLGLIPLDLFYVLQTGGSTYGLLMLFVRTVSFWAVIQLANYVYRLAYPAKTGTGDASLDAVASHPSRQLIPDKLLQ